MNYEMTQFCAYIFILQGEAAIFVLIGPLFPLRVITVTLSLFYSECMCMAYQQSQVISVILIYKKFFQNEIIITNRFQIKQKYI